MICNADTNGRVTHWNLLEVAKLQFLSCSGSCSTGFNLLLKVDVEKQRGIQLCHLPLFPKLMDVCEGLHSLAEKQWFKDFGLSEVNVWNSSFL